MERVSACQLLLQREFAIVNPSPILRPLCGLQVYSSGQPFSTADAYETPSFNREFDGETGLLNFTQKGRHVGISWERSMRCVCRVESQQRAHSTLFPFPLSRQRRRDRLPDQAGAVRAALRELREGGGSGAGDQQADRHPLQRRRPQAL